MFGIFKVPVIIFNSKKFLIAITFVLALVLLF